MDLQTLCIIVIIGGAIAMLVRATASAAKRPTVQRHRLPKETIALDDALGKVNETVRIVQELLGTRAPGRRDPGGTRFYIAYLIGVAREIAKMNGVAYGPALETPIRMEMIRLGIAEGGPEALARLLASEEGENGLASGELDGRDACAGNYAGPYFARIQSYFESAAVSDDD